MKSKVYVILRLIQKAYGNSRPFRRTDPVDELVRTILSQNTSDTNSFKAFAILKKHFGAKHFGARPLLVKSFRKRGQAPFRWERLLRTDTRKIAGLIRRAGLANIKARRIKAVLSEIKKREGRLSLASLGGRSDEEALSYLRSLDGVGPKTAACVLLFSFGRPVMPVDTHIFRVAGRLGLIGPGLSIGEAHDALTMLVPKGLIYPFHLGIIEHGRRTCKARNPRCGFCVLYKFCKFKDKAKRAS